MRPTLGKNRKTDSQSKVLFLAAKKQGVRGQLLLEQKRGKERKDLVRADEASSVAQCFVS